MNNADGFVLNFTGGNVLRENGNCIRENCMRISDFWKKGWSQTRLLISHIKRVDDGAMIKHVNIYNEKTGKIVDVSNGMIKMIDIAKWASFNDVKKLASIRCDTLVDTDMTDVDLLAGICNAIFRSYEAGDDKWAVFKEFKEEEEEMMISGVKCNICKNELPPHTTKRHLNVEDPIHKCPHS